MSPVARVFVWLILAYRLLVSPFTKPSCRYLPTCSQYAIDAVTAHGAFRGTWLAARRIGRCHPWGGHGFDPVPIARDIGKESHSHG